MVYGNILGLSVQTDILRHDSNIWKIINELELEVTSDFPVGLSLARPVDGWSVRGKPCYELIIQEGQIPGTSVSRYALGGLESVNDIVTTSDYLKFTFNDRIFTCFFNNLPLDSDQPDSLVNGFYFSKEATQELGDTSQLEQTLHVALLAYGSALALGVTVAEDGFYALGPLQGEEPMISSYCLKNLTPGTRVLSSSDYIDFNTEGAFLRGYFTPNKFDEFKCT